MSDYIGPGFILAIALGGHFVYLYSHRFQAEVAHIIASGATNGAPLPLRARWATLRNEYIHLVTQGPLVLIMIGIFEILVARQIGDEDFRYFGYLHAIFIFLAAFVTTGWGVMNLRSLTSTLRQAEAD
jgi:hypothetical protein